jgi:hypothetical protein
MLKTWSGLRRRSTRSRSDSDRPQRAAVEEPDLFLDDQQLPCALGCDVERLPDRANRVAAASTIGG